MEIVKLKIQSLKFRTPKSRLDIEEEKLNELEDKSVDKSQEEGWKIGL